MLVLDFHDGFEVLCLLLALLFLDVEVNDFHVYVLF
jgi:hypothetical protein